MGHWTAKGLDHGSRKVLGVGVEVGGRLKTGIALPPVLTFQAPEVRAELVAALRTVEKMVVEVRLVLVWR